MLTNKKRRVPGRSLGSSEVRLRAALPFRYVRTRVRTDGAGRGASPKMMPLGSASISRTVLRVAKRFTTVSLGFVVRPVAEGVSGSEAKRPVGVSHGATAAARAFY